MHLSTRLAGEFSATVRKRGESYYRQGRVRIQKGSASALKARVRGSGTYDVTLDWQPGTLSVWCDCPYYDGYSNCKHLWAAILAADAHGYLTAPASATNLTIELNREISVDEEGLDDFSVEVQPPAPPPKPPEPPLWLKQIDAIAKPAAPDRSSDPLPPRRQILYIVDVPSSISAGALVLLLASGEFKADGSMVRHAALTIGRSQIPKLPTPEDREIMAALAGGKQHYAYGYADYYEQLPTSCRVIHPLASMIIPTAVRTGRCFLQNSARTDDLTPLKWDDGGPWQFQLEMRRKIQDPKQAHNRNVWEVAGVLHRSHNGPDGQREERMDLSAAILITQGGLVFTADQAAPLAEDTPFDWIFNLRKVGSVQAPEADRDELLAALLRSPNVPALKVPEELRYEEVTCRPRPRLQVRQAHSYQVGAGRLKGDLSFDYEGRVVPSREPTGGFYDAATRRFVRRDSQAEAAAAVLLRDQGFKQQSSVYFHEPAWELASTKLPRVARNLVEAGWHIEAEGKIFRRSDSFRLEVSSGIDWFELHGEVSYGDSTAKLPALLEAARRGESMVQLDDGTYGLLPEDWLRKIGLVASTGTAENGHIRFRASQAGLLDALLAVQPEASCDAIFTRVREELRAFAGVDAAEQPAGFVGQLRDYQREGLGWMQFLRRFSLGGCLADDMGVGKTAQVLALLETRRAAREAGEAVGPSLVVVPRSLIFNWKQEAARFTPQLRVLDYTGIERGGNGNAEGFAGYDLVLTTYGTVRRDVLHLQNVEFDYIVLDEAQAIKNANTDSAKAVRLLRGGHRLALSGTPIENHLGELWSLFEFLNPGMLGAASVFKLTGATARKPDEDTRRLLAHALRPFILRRTKEQVARELPSKTEQTVYCEMEPVQRKLYNELRQHYRNSLLKRIDTEGLAKSKIQVLEALLRLRQAACHPGLIDLKRSAEPSAKLEVLLEQLREVLDEGHKALVFSQFTSLLRIVRDRLESRGIVYEYLDGATTNRQAPVERFQNDPDCKLFLISLKAGGLGLNLTAAEYVFLLDPWWNPAVEAQAVDRAHRIGQTKQVFAYRLIAKDTVEEKVLELQSTKRDLVAAIIGEDNSLIRNLGREDLEMLLS